MVEKKKIRDFIEPYNFVACPKETPLLKALELAKAPNDSMHPILIKENDEMIGIFTESDLCSLILKQIELSNLLMESVMTQSPYFLESSAEIDTCIFLMLKNHFRHIPIKNQRGRVYAVADVYDILKAKVQEVAEIQSLEPPLEQN